MKKIKLDKNLSEVFDELHVSEHEDNYKKIEDTINSNTDDMTYHRNSEDNAHSSNQIRHVTKEGLNSNSQSEMRYQREQIAELVLGANGDGVQEVRASRVSMDAIRHADLDNRLYHDFLREENERKKGDNSLGDRINKTYKESSYIPNIDFRKLHYRVGTTDTEYYLIDVPQYDEVGNKIKLKHGFSDDKFGSPDFETARSFSDRHYASAVFNASVFNMSTNKIIGNQIKDGKILKSDGNTDRTYRWHLGFKADGTMRMYPNGTTADEMIKDGVVDSVTAFYPVILNRKHRPDIYGQHADSATFHPRHVIAQRESGDYVFLSSEGRSIKHRGLTIGDCYKILSDNYNDIVNAYVLDGGGSTSSVVNGMMTNRPYDSSLTAERKVPDFIYFSRDVISERDRHLYSVMKQLGYVRKELSNLESAVTYIRDMNLGHIRLYQNAPFDQYGIEIRRKENGEDNYLGKLLMNDEVISYKPNPEKTGQIPLFQITDEDVWFNGSRLGNSYNITKNINKITEITYSGWYYMNKDASDNPYKNEDTGCYILYMTSDNHSGLAIATPLSKQKQKKRIKSDDAWNEWFDNE